MSREEELLELRKQRLDIDIKIKELVHQQGVDSLKRVKDTMQRNFDEKLHDLNKRTERNKRIVELRRSGMSLREVGKLFNMSHEAIRLIESKNEQ